MEYERDLTSINKEDDEDVKSTDIIFMVTDEDGIEHKLRMLTIFTAGALKRQYVAGMTCDILLYRYKTVQIGEETKEYVFEIINEIEYSQVLKEWEQIIASGIDESDIRVATVYITIPMDDGSTTDIPISGTVFKIFKVDSNVSNECQYMAICPQNIMFYRYTEDMTENSESVTISQIYSSQEYEDVSNEFHKMIVNDNLDEL